MKKEEKNTEEATTKALSKTNVSERTFIVEEKVTGTCYWESLSREFDNIQQARHFFKRHYKKYSKNIRLVEVYAH